MQEKNLAGRFSPKNTMSETDGQTDTETEREGETGGRGRVTEREARQEQKADPRAGVGAMVQWGQIRGTVREGGWPPWERACGGVGGGPSPNPSGLVPGPEAHQASPRCGISHTWESPRRRSSLGVGKGKGEKEVSDSGLGSGAAASLHCPQTHLSRWRASWDVCPAHPS